MLYLIFYLCSVLRKWDSEYVEQITDRAFLMLIASIYTHTKSTVRPLYEIFQITLEKTK